MPKNHLRLYRAADAVVRGVLRSVPVTDFTERAAAWWGYRYGLVPGVVKLRSGLRIHVRNPTDFLQMQVYYTGTFEEHCLQHMRRLAKPGDTVLDVGANIGVHTLEAARIVGPAGKVIAIEAAPTHVEAIKENVALNGFGNVDVIEMAASDRQGMATLRLPTLSNLGMYRLGGEGTAAFNVALGRLDDVVDQRIDFLKMDIEGSEYRALLGAARLISTHKPAILIELNDSALSDCGSSSAEVKEMLSALGYKGQIISRNGTRSLGDRHHCDECLFLHHDAAISNGPRAVN